MKSRDLELAKAANQNIKSDIEYKYQKLRNAATDFHNVIDSVLNAIGGAIIRDIDQDIKAGLG